MPAVLPEEKFPTSSEVAIRHPKAVVVQTPVLEWLRWLERVAEFTSMQDS
jgi:hypothetical protein